MKKKTVKEVKMHIFLVCRWKSQDFAQSQKNCARAHDRATKTFRNSDFWTIFYRKNILCHLHVDIWIVVHYSTHPSQISLTYNSYKMAKSQKDIFSNCNQTVYLFSKISLKAWFFQNFLVAMLPLYQGFCNSGLGFPKGRDEGKLHVTCSMWHMTGDGWHMTCYFYGSGRSYIS